MSHGGVDVGACGKGRDRRDVFHCCKLVNNQLCRQIVTRADLSLDEALLFLADCTAVTVEVPNAAAGVFRKGAHSQQSLGQQASVMRTAMAATRLAASLSARGVRVFEHSAQTIRSYVGCTVVTRGARAVPADTSVLSWCGFELRRLKHPDADALLHPGDKRFKVPIPTGALGSTHLRDAFLAACCARLLAGSRQGG